VTYAMFDLLVDGGKDIMGLPLIECNSKFPSMPTTSSWPHATWVPAL
jgi:hypothetical protein